MCSHLNVSNLVPLGVISKLNIFSVVRPVVGVKEYTETLVEATGKLSPAEALKESQFAACFSQSAQLV
jgi:hypothetical protein